MVRYDSEIKKSKLFFSGLSTGLNNPTDKGKCLILLYIGSEDGFVEGCSLIFNPARSFNSCPVVNFVFHAHRLHCSNDKTGKNGRKE